MQVKAEIVRKVSKAGKEYIVVEIQLTSDYKKEVFLEKSEQSLIKLAYGSKQDNK